jgi:glycosyltransferase involved in cell wall biosynthesis
MEKASILMLVWNYRGVGGHDIVINNLCFGLRKLGYNIAIGSFSFDRNPPEDIEKVHLKKFRSLDGYDFDIIHSHQPRMNYYSLLTSRPFICHNHGPSTRIQEINLIASILLSKNKLSRIISISNSALNQLNNLVGTGILSKIPLDVIYNGVDSTYYHTNLPRPYAQGDPQLLFVGILYTHKNVLQLIEAMPAILKLYPKAHLQIVGDGDDYKRLHREIKKQKLENKVELVGLAFGENLRLRYSSCDIYLSASKWEMFDLPALEAMACGKPVLLSDIPAHKELLEGSNAGLTFSLLDTSNIQNSIQEIYNNRKNFSSAARKFAEKYDWSFSCTNLSRIYDRIMLQN